MSTLKSNHDWEKEKEKLTEKILNQAEKIYREKGIEFSKAVNEAKQEILHPQILIAKRHPSALEVHREKQNQEIKRTIAELKRLNLEL